MLCRMHYYSPHPKDGEGTVFTGVCLSTGGREYPGTLLSGPRSFPGGRGYPWSVIPGLLWGGEGLRAGPL